MVRYLSNSDDPNSQLIWIDTNQELPNVCCTCGMFTADRQKIKHASEVVQAKRSSLWGILNVILILFGGPIGWLIALFSGSGGDSTSTKVKKYKVKIPQCVLCRSETRVDIVASDPERSLYQFFVNPIFAERYFALVSKNAESDGF